jgi:hypothetical protein
MAEYTLHCFAQAGNAYRPGLAREFAAPRRVRPYERMPGHPLAARPAPHGRN